MAKSGLSIDWGITYNINIKILGMFWIIPAFEIPEHKNIADNIIGLKLIFNVLILWFYNFTVMLSLRSEQLASKKLADGLKHTQMLFWMIAT